MMRKTCFICAAVFVSTLFSAVCVSAAAETAGGKDTKPAKASSVLKMKNPYERDIAKIEEMVKKQKNMPVGRKRDFLGAKIVLEQKKLEERMKKNVKAMNHSLEQLERQYERAKDEAKQKELGIKINKIRATIALHEAWCSDDPDKADQIKAALEQAEKAFSPEANGRLSEDEEEDEEEEEEEEDEEDEKDKKKDKKEDKKEEKDEEADGKSDEKDDSVKKDEAKKEEAETESDDGKEKSDSGDKSSEKETKEKKGTKAKKSGKSGDDADSDKSSGKKKTKKSNKKSKK